jgi:glycosyltransferase involved in cell wall biosynthesis
MFQDMKVGFILSQPFGHSLGTDARIRGLIKGLSHLGVEIHIITPFVEDFSNACENIHVHRVSSISAKLNTSNLAYHVSKRFVTNSVVFRKLMCRMPLFHRSARSLGKGVQNVVSRLDLDVLQAEQQVASLAGVTIGKKLGIPIVADFHGIWAEEMVASGVVDYDDACYKTLSNIEGEIAHSADAVVVVSEEMKNYVEKSFDVSASKVAVVPNATFPRVSKAKFVENPSGVIHSGTLHPWENVELFIHAIPLVLKLCPKATFYLTRKGAKLNKIMKLSQSLNVFPEFTWFDSESGFFEFLKSCDIGVISSTTHIARNMAYPAKLYDYLSVGLPIVANDVGSWTKIIKENRVGIVTASSPEAFAGGILELMENPKLLCECGQRGIELVRRELNYYNSARKLLSLYGRLT